MRRPSLALALLVAPILLVPAGACSGEDGVGPAASAALSPRVQDIRAAATASDRDAALAGVAALRREVEQLRASGQLGDPQAATVLQASAEVERQLMFLPATPTRPGGEGDVIVGPTSRGAEDQEAKADEDARKRAEEAAKKAEEEEEKLIEESKKRAEDAKKKKE